MEFRTEITEPAERDIEDAYLWLYEQKPRVADNWYRGLCRAVFSLSELPKRCPLAAESEDLDREIRQLLYGRGRQMYRILFEIRDGTVYVLRVRHSYRAELSPEELG